MSAIPLPYDVREWIGDFAEKVENRSLLLDKMAFPKTGLGAPMRANSAGRWSLLRLTEEGRKVLREEAKRASHPSSREGFSKGKEQDRYAASLLPCLADSRCETDDAQDLRTQHSRRFLQLARDNVDQASTTFCARLRSRLAINLSDGLIQNGGIALDRLFGLPYVPGSALKGCARHAAMRVIRSLPEADRPAAVSDFMTIFGVATNDFKDSDFARLLSFLPAADRPAAKDLRGAVSFFPAFPVTDAHLEVDLTNVHTPAYYTGKPAGTPAALRNEKPLPNPFPVVAAGTGFAFGLFLSSQGRRHSNPEALLARAREWLVEALTVDGIGAKTGAGYGWFALAPDLDSGVAAELEADAAKAADAERARAEQAAAAERQAAERAAQEERLASLSPAERACEEALQLDDPAFAEAILKIEEKTTDEQKGIVLAALSKAKRDRLKRWAKKKKPTDQKRMELLTRFAAQFDLPMP